MGLLRVLGVLVVLLFALGFWLLLRRMPNAPYSSWLLITGGGFILLIPYVLGESNDYRLIVLLLPLAGLLRWRAAVAATGWLWWVVGLVAVALLTGSAMVPNEFGFLVPKPVLLLGDLALAGALGFTLAVWLRGWVGSRPVGAESLT